MQEIAISKFKATCLAALERVRTTGEPLRVTRRGLPVAEIVPPQASARRGSLLGCWEHEARIIGDLITPVFDESDFESLQD